MATNGPITLYQYADVTLRLNVATTDGGSTPQTMTGWALGFYVRRVTDKKVVLSYTTGAGITIGNGAGTDDRASVAVQDTDVTAAPGRDYEYALWRTDDGSDVPLRFGQCTILSVARQA